MDFIRINKQLSISTLAPCRVLMLFYGRYDSLCMSLCESPQICNVVSSLFVFDRVVVVCTRSGESQIMMLTNQLRRFLITPSICVHFLKENAI